MHGDGAGLRASNGRVTEEAVEVFRRREDAAAALEDCLRDEPDWKDVLRVVPIELDGRTFSAN